MKQQRQRFGHVRLLGSRLAKASVLALMAACVAGSAGAQTAAAGAEHRLRQLANVERALGQLRDAADRKGFSPAFLREAENASQTGDLTRLEQTEGPVITVGTQQIQLASDYIRLSELGSSLQAREDRGNLDRLYRMAYTVAQPEIRAKLPTPERVAHESIAVMQADIELVALELDLANVNVFHPIGVESMEMLGETAKVR